MDRTVVLNIHPTPEQARILYRTLVEHTACFNAVVHEGFTQHVSNGVELHKQTYYPLRAEHPDWKEQERRLFRLRRKLQKKGTPSAKRHLKKLSGKLLRQRRDHDHVFSKRIVEHATPGAAIVIENLTYIRERTKMKHGKGQRRLHSWSFAQFQSFLSYKAQERGMVVVKIDPRHTSQTCFHCGYQARNNRRSQSLSHCRSCGYQLNADFNAALNIRDKHLACFADIGTSFVGGLSSSCLSHPPSGEMQAPAL